MKLKLLDAVKSNGDGDWNVGLDGKEKKVTSFNFRTEF